MNQRLRHWTVAALAVAVLGIAPANRAADRPNVLLLSIDDLRNDLGCLGVGHAKTPHLDALAASGRLFTHHYVQVPTCGASRCALIRGRYPDLPAHLGNRAIAATHGQWGAASLPAVFRQHGFANGVPRTRGESPPWEAFDGPDESYPDAWVAAEAVETLRQLAESEEPWFFAVGFFIPHLPFAAPKKWSDLHDPDKIPAPPVTDRPAPPSGWHGSGEFRRNYGHDGRDPDDDPAYAQLMRQAYAASTSYMDAQLGRVAQALEQLAGDAGSDTGFGIDWEAIPFHGTLCEPALLTPFDVIGQFDSDEAEGVNQHHHRRRRMDPVTVHAILDATARQFGTSAADDRGFRVRAGGRDVAAMLCRRWTTATLRKLSPRFGGTHPDSASDPIARAKRSAKSNRNGARHVAWMEQALALNPESQV